MQSDFTMHVLGVLYRESLHGAMYWKASLLFSSERIEVSHPILWSFIYFEMILIMMRDSGQVPAFFVWMSIFPAPFVEEFVLYKNGCFRYLCCKSVGYKSLGSYFCNLCDYVGLCVCCLPILCCLGYTPTVSSRYHGAWGHFSSLLWYVVFYNFVQMSGFFPSSLKTVIHILEGTKTWACRF